MLSRRQARPGLSDEEKTNIGKCIEWMEKKFEKTPEFIVGIDNWVKSDFDDGQVEQLLSSAGAVAAVGNLEGRGFHSLLELKELLYLLYSVPSFIWAIGKHVRRLLFGEKETMLSVVKQCFLKETMLPAGESRAPLSLKAVRRSCKI